MLTIRRNVLAAFLIPLACLSLLFFAINDLLI